MLLGSYLLLTGIGNEEFINSNCKASGVMCCRATFTPLLGKAALWTAAGTVPFAGSSGCSDKRFGVHQTEINGFLMKTLLVCTRAPDSGSACLKCKKAH